MTTDKTPYDFVKTEPSIRDQFIRMGLAAVGGFIVESLIKAGYDHYVINRRNKIE